MKETAIVFTEENFQVSRAEDKDVMLSFIGRVKLPDLVVGSIQNNSLIINQTSGISISFTNLSEEVVEWIMEAPVVYVVRVLNEKIYTSICNINPLISI